MHTRSPVTHGTVVPQMMAMPPLDEKPVTKRVDSDPLSNHAAAVNEHFRQAKKAEKQARQQIANAVGSAFLAGLALIEMKKLVKHGAWTETLRKKCPEISQRTANRFMSLAREYKDRPDELPQRPLRELYGSKSEKDEDKSNDRTKAKSTSRKKTGRSGGLSHEAKSLMTLLQHEEPASFVSEICSKERVRLINELQKLIKLLTHHGD